MSELYPRNGREDSELDALISVVARGIVLLTTSDMAMSVMVTRRE